MSKNQKLMEKLLASHQHNPLVPELVKELCHEISVEVHGWLEYGSLNKESLDAFLSDLVIHGAKALMHRSTFSEKELLTWYGDMLQAQFKPIKDFELYVHIDAACKKLGTDFHKEYNGND